jgi:superfamily I DNA/RNA helicase
MIVMMNRITRRAALKGATATATALALPGPASATVASNDAQLVALVERLEALGNRFCEACRETAAREAAAKARLPALPEITRATDTDLTVHRLPPPQAGYGRRVSHYTPFMREELAQYHPSRSRIFPQAENRQREILAALDAWVAQRESIRNSMGIPELEAREELLLTEFDEMADKVATMPTHGADGLKAKVRAILAIHDGKLPSGKDETTDRQLMLQIVGALAG